MSTFSIIDEEQAPRKHDGRGLTRTRNIDRDTKQCRTCNRILPFRLFVPTGSYIKSIGRKCGSADCRDCLARKRRAAGIPERHPRINGRGEVWCNNCRQYRPTSDFRRHPQRPHTWWAYCKPCTRELDRLRWRGDRRQRLNTQRIANQRRKRQVAFAERRRFLADTIDLLLRRGLTISEIGRLTGIGLSNIYKYQASETRRPTEAVTARFEQLLRLTMDWPLGEPARRRRIPHPEIPALTAAMASTIAAHPVRSSWKDGKR